MESEIKSVGCGNCKFFFSYECRKRPPYLSHQGKTEWPTVLRSHWCGSWEADERFSLEETIRVSRAIAEDFERRPSTRSYAHEYRESMRSAQARLDELGEIS